MKGAQCYELFGGIALKNHAFSFFYDSHFLGHLKCMNKGLQNKKMIYTCYFAALNHPHPRVDTLCTRLGRIQFATYFFTINNNNNDGYF